MGNDISGETFSSGVNTENLLGKRISLSSDGMTTALSSPLNGGVSNNSGSVQVFDLSAVLSLENKDLIQFSLYPNPSNDEFTIQLNGNIGLEKVSIYNQLGQLVKVSSTDTTGIQDLSSGIYFVEISTDQGKSIQKLIID